MKGPHTGLNPIIRFLKRKNKLVNIFKDCYTINFLDWKRNSIKLSPDHQEENISKSLWIDWRVKISTENICFVYEFCEFLSRALT